MSQLREQQVAFTGLMQVHHRMNTALLQQCEVEVTAVDGVRDQSVA